MTCNRNRHYEFNRKRRLLSRLNLEFFTLRHCAMNRGFESRISCVVIGSYVYVSGMGVRRGSKRLSKPR